MDSLGFLDRRFCFNVLSKVLVISLQPSGQHSHSYSFDLAGSHFSTNLCGLDELFMVGLK